jgi:hypothetical protein
LSTSAEIRFEPRLAKFGRWDDGLGTGDPAVEREDQKAARMVQSICKGC